MSTPISKIIELAGTQQALANRIGVSQAAVSKWANGRPMSAENALAIQDEFDGAFSAKALAPHAFRRRRRTESSSTTQAA